MKDGAIPTYFDQEAAEKLSKRISDMSSKVATKKSNIAKIKAAEQLLSELKGKDIEEHKFRDKKYNWRYAALTPDGRTVKGFFEAYSKADVINFLADDNLIVYKIRLEKFVISFGGKGRKLKNKELLFILTQLSTYLKSGISLSEAIGILIKQSKKSSHKSSYLPPTYFICTNNTTNDADNHVIEEIICTTLTSFSANKNSMRQIEPYHILNPMDTTKPKLYRNYSCYFIYA